jgi:hypothetical protein
MEQVREERTPNTMPSGPAVMSVSAPVIQEEDTGGVRAKEKENTSAGAM